MRRTASHLYRAAAAADLGVEVCEIQQRRGSDVRRTAPEPAIPPWVDRCIIAKVPERRLRCQLHQRRRRRPASARWTRHGNFMNPHRIITLLTSHLAGDKEYAVASCLPSCVGPYFSSPVQARKSMELTSTGGADGGYAEMEKGRRHVLGGEEVPAASASQPRHGHDDLLMALLLCARRWRSAA